MKKTILILIVIMSVSSYSQCSKAQDKWNGFTFYAPNYTKHYVYDKLFEDSKSGSEGGNVGLVLSYSKNKSHYSIGYMKNSYGDYSKLVMYGYTLAQNRKNQLTINAGLIDNYDVSYGEEKNMKVYKKIYPDVLINNNTLAVIILTYKRDLFRVGKSNVGLQLNIAPLYVNAGVFVKL